MDRDLSGAVVVIMTTALLLLLRQLILSMGKRRRDNYTRDPAPGSYRSETVRNQSESANPVEARAVGTAFIETCEFLTELQNHSATLKR